MPLRATTASLLLALGILGGCGGDGSTRAVAGDSRSLRVVNAFNGPVDVVLDGAVVARSVPAGALDTIAAIEGTHTLALQPSAGGGTGQSQSITIASGALSTVAVVRASSGNVATEILDDTGSVVPVNATKLRVLHLAPNAGVLQVYRTQPDYQTPISWQFPFTYQASIDGLSAPFYQSTVGTWEVRIWQSPADASGWTTAPVRVVVPLGGGEKHTILILDAPGGGVRAEVI